MCDIHVVLISVWISCRTPQHQQMMATAVLALTSHLTNPALQLHEVVMAQAADGAAKGGSFRDDIVGALARGLLGHAHDCSPQWGSLSGHQGLCTSASQTLVNFHP